MSYMLFLIVRIVEVFVKVKLNEIYSRIDPYTEVMPLKEGYYATTGMCMMDEGNYEAVLVFTTVQKR